MNIVGRKYRRLTLDSRKGHDGELSIRMCGCWRRVIGTKFLAQSRETFRSEKDTKQDAVEARG